MKVWVVNCGDTGCDKDEYVAVAEAFATREAAHTAMACSVHDDEECFEVTALWKRWDEGKMVAMAVVDCGFGRRIVYTLREMEVW